MDGVPSQLATQVATISAGVVVILAILLRGWSFLRRTSQADNTETETLRLLQAAVDHWRGLYDTAWEQVKKERQLRESAEMRAAETMTEVEALRGEVAEMQRKIDHLTALVRGLGGGALA